MTSDTSLPIGIFDSGVGGLTVTRAITERLPHERLLYLGDTARVPYGNRGEHTVRRYALNATRLLIDEGIKALVVACNTATAHGLDALREAHPNLPIIGVITPVAEQATARTQTRSIGVIGTRGTIQSGCYVRALSALLPDAQITQIACPLFVPLAEEGWLRGEVPEKVAATYLDELKASSIDTLILGCTHYPMLRDTIATTLDAIMPHYVTLLDCAQSTSTHLVDVLTAANLLAPDDSPPQPPKSRIRFLVTDEPKGFMATAIRFFGGPIQRPEHVDIIMEDDPS